MGILRWLDESNKGLFLGFKCNGTQRLLPDCITSNSYVHDLTGHWETGGFPNATLKGSQKSSFCPPEGRLSLHVSHDYPYHCTSGAEASSVRILKDEIDALKAVQKYAYFRCVTYDELFAVYVGVIGVLIAVALTTTTLFITDVARPMLLAGRESWSWDIVDSNVGDVCSEDSEQRYVREQNVLDVVLRCAASFAIGGVLAMGLIYLPWQAFLKNQGQACDAA